MGSTLETTYATPPDTTKRDGDGWYVQLPLPLLAKPLFSGRVQVPLFALIPSALIPSRAPLLMHGLASVR